MNKYLLLLLLPFVTFASYGVNGSDQDLKLWYDRPADYWVEALPLGNGHLGAMMYGIASLIDEVSMPRLRSCRWLISLLTGVLRLTV